MFRKFLVASCFVVSFVPIAACNGGGGGGGKKATIESFAANPTILPTEGGAVTLTWHVTGAEELEIEPGVGLVYGTAGSLTVTVTESTTFRLTARRDGNKRRAEASVTVTAPEAVVGTVRSMLNTFPLAEVIVSIDGHDPVVTDENGQFTFANVSTPYSVVLLPQDGPIVVFDGLTRFDPTLEVPFAGPSGEPFQLTVDGSVSPVPEAGTSETRVFVETDGFFDQLLQGFLGPPAFADPTTGAFSVQTIAFAPLDQPLEALVHALRWDLPGGPDTPIASYRYGSTTVEVEHDVPASGATVTLADAGVAETRFEFGDIMAEGVLPGGEPFLGVGLGERTGTGADRGFLLPPAAMLFSGMDLGFLRMPDLEDSWFVAAFPYEHELAPSAFGIRIFSEDAGTETVTMDFPVPARSLLPVEEGTLKRSGGELQIEGQQESVKLWFLDFSGPFGSREVLVVSTKERVGLPDLEAVGVSYDTFLDLDWFVFEMAPRASTDEAAGPDGIMGIQPEFLSGSAERTAFLED